MRLRNGSLVSPLLFGWNAPKGLSNHLIYCCSAIALKFTFSHALLSFQTFISLFSSLWQGIVESWWRTEWAFYQCWISTGNKLVSSMERKREKKGLRAIGRNGDSSKIAIRRNLDLSKSQMGPFVNHIKLLLVRCCWTFLPFFTWCPIEVAAFFLRPSWP